jgi:hypothetical protein
MKLLNPKKQEAALFGSLLLTLLLMLLVSGCTSGSGASNSAGGSSSGSSSSGGRTLKETDMDVSWPMTKFRNAAGFGKVTATEQKEVNDAYARYEAAYREALQAAHNNPNAPAPANVKALANQVIEAVQSISLL